ncbi:hypothetical protein E2C01_055279 [Portunus trituberculatus]|uniref:Uncharacterized protein n=1 Tax=Portunus trituberculatus TaxID=210409 RepID=A0A5B7GUA3_PORTR|nr:hypothetical protein [Portunus trituberculatus]
MTHRLLFFSLVTGSLIYKISDSVLLSWYLLSCLIFFLYLSFLLLFLSFHSCYLFSCIFHFFSIFKSQHCPLLKIVCPRTTVNLAAGCYLIWGCGVGVGLEDLLPATGTRGVLDMALAHARDTRVTQQPAISSRSQETDAFIRNCSLSFIV